MTVDKQGAAEITGGIGLLGLALLNLTCSLVFISGMVIGGLMIAESVRSHDGSSSLLVGLCVAASSSCLSFLFAGVSIVSAKDFFRTRLRLNGDGIFDNRFMDTPLRWGDIKSATIAYNARRRPHALRIKLLAQDLPTQTRFRIGCTTGQSPQTSVISLFGLSKSTGEIIMQVRQSARVQNVEIVDPHAQGSAKSP